MGETSDQELDDSDDGEKSVEGNKSLCPILGDDEGSESEDDSDFEAASEHPSDEAEDASESEDSPEDPKVDESNKPSGSRGDAPCMDSGSLWSLFLRILQMLDGINARSAARSTRATSLLVLAGMRPAWIPVRGGPCF